MLVVLAATKSLGLLEPREGEPKSPNAARWPRIVPIGPYSVPWLPLMT